MATFYIFTGDKDTIPLTIKKIANGRKIVYLDDLYKLKQRVTINNLFDSNFFVTNCKASELKGIIPYLRQDLAVLHDKGTVPKGMEKYVVRVDAINEQTLASYISSELGTGKALTDYIVSNVLNAQHAATEVAKLKTYPNPLTLGVVKELITPKLENKVFDLVNATLNRDIDKGMKHFDELLKLKEPTLKLLSVFYTLYKNTFIVLANNTSEAKVLADKTGLSYYQVKMILGKASTVQIDNKRLLDTIQAIFRTEVLIKSGQMEESVALQHLMIKIFS